MTERHHAGRRSRAELEASYSRDARYSCRVKIAYTTKNAARYNAAIRSKEIGEPLEAYKCRRSKGGCGDWHIGHPPGWKYQAHKDQELDR